MAFFLDFDLINGHFFVVIFIKFKYIGSLIYILYLLGLSILMLCFPNKLYTYLSLKLINPVILQKYFNKKYIFFSKKGPKFGHFTKSF